MAQKRVRQAKRAGGHIATPHGWRLVAKATSKELGETPQPEPEPAPVEESASAVSQAAADTPQERERDRDECPDCGKQVAVNKDGTLRKHTCVIEAPPPAVTFDDEGEEHGGDSASEGW